MLRLISKTKTRDSTNIRAAADKNSRVLKRIRTQSAVVVTITGYKDGWFEISSAKEADDDGGVLFEGRGWIHSSIVGMRVGCGDARLYAEAKKGIRVLMKLKAEESALKLVACRNDWVKLQTDGKTGWLVPGGQCGNPLTTCP
jgi:SH3-like domain-containing protein